MDTLAACMSEGRYLLDDEALKHELAVGALQEAALHTVGCGQPEDQHRPGLPNPVSPVHGLLTHNQPQTCCFRGIEIPLKFFITMNGTKICSWKNDKSLKRGIACKTGTNVDHSA